MSLRAVTLDGRERIVLAAAVSMLPHDVAPDGRVLASTIEGRARLFYRGDPASPDREFSVQANTIARAISSDGSWVAFSDDTFNGVSQCYLRSSSGAPPVSLGPGVPAGFAPDGKTLVVVQPEVPAVVLHPIGPGRSTTIRLDGFEIGSFKTAGLLRDGKTIWFSGNQPSRPQCIWEVAVSGGKPRPLTLEGVSGWVTDDGASVVSYREGKYWIRPIASGEPRTVDGLLEGEMVAAWTAEGKPLFVYLFRQCPAKIYRLDPKTRRREFFREIGPADPTGVFSVSSLMTPEGKAYACVVSQWLSELHMIEGLR